MFSANSSQVSSDANYIEDVFSTYLYTGNAPSSQSINNGINLSGNGGLVWLKNRSVGTGIGHELYNTTVGAGNFLSSNNTNANTSTTAGGTTYGLSAFNSNGFTVNDNWSGENTNGQNIASWTFRKQPKFFDVVTYTGDGTSNRAVSHNLGSIPACIFLKRTDSAASWFVYHRATGGTPQDNILQLNTTDPLATSAGYWGTTPFTDTQFRVSSFGGFNASGGTYVAYVFAHNAGGFGLTGTDNVISCGSYTDNGTDQIINLGYEPQWILVKDYASSAGWYVIDTMRGWRGQPVSATASVLYPNFNNAEVANGGWLAITQTGFQIKSGSGLGNSSFIYIAIRRGPMKVPTSGTSVFAIDTRNATTPSFVSNFPVDMSTYRAKSGSDWYLQSRLTPNYLLTNSTDAEAAGYVFSATQFAYNTGWGSSGASIPDLFSYMWQRAPSFFDEVCYSGNSVAGQTYNHNLTVAPELMIVKRRNTSGFQWVVYAAPLGASKYVALNLTDAAAGDFMWNATAPTSSVFTVSANQNVNNNAGTYVAYLFTTCTGVSKVGSYTGTGTTKQIDCGFTGGARFVLIKRTDSTGDWYVWDTARGIVSGNDPYLLLNSTAAEVTNTDYVDTYSAGFEISSTAPAAINASGGTFIFLAIA